MFSVVCKNRIIIGGLNAPNLLQQLELLAVAFMRNWRNPFNAWCDRSTRNWAVQRFRQQVIKTDGKGKQYHAECHNIASEQWLVQIKVVNNKNGSKL